VPSNLIPIAAPTQSIENKLAWWKIEPKNSAAFRFFYFQRFNYSRLRGRSENRAQNVAFKHRIRSICLDRHCYALHFGHKRTGTSNMNAVNSNILKYIVVRESDCEADTLVLHQSVGIFIGTNLKRPLFLLPSTWAQSRVNNADRYNNRR